MKFSPAALPDESFDVDTLMKKFSIAREEAEHIVAVQNRTRVFMNDK